MHPLICKIGPFTIYSYGLMLAVAFFISSTLAAKRAEKLHIDPNIIFNLCFIAFISGIIGARLLYIVQNLTFYLKTPSEIIMLQHGGLSWFGGLVFGTIVGIGYLKSKKLASYKTLDLIAPFAALGQAIGRIGCFLNGCCFGRGWLPIPLQLTSSLLLIFIFIVLRLLQEEPHRDGQVFFTYLLLYSLKRFFIEFWRSDNEIIFFGLTLFQLMSITIFCLLILKLILIARTRE